MRPPLDIPQRLDTAEHLHGDHSMGKFNIVTAVAQGAIMDTNMIPLSAVRNG